MVFGLVLACMGREITRGVVELTRHVEGHIFKGHLLFYDNNNINSNKITLKS